MISAYFSVFLVSLFAGKVHLSILFPQFLSDQDKIRNERPIIGILTLETDMEIKSLGKQYLSAHYVKLVESGGARAAPIFINSTDEQIAKIFSYINGAILPGGHVKLHVSNYTRVGNQIFQLAKKANDEGKVFPIWAECLGLELLTLLVAERNMSFGQYDETFFKVNNVRFISLPIQLQQDYRSSRLLGRAALNIIDAFKKPVTYNNHKRSLMMELYQNSKKLKDFFRVVGTSETDGMKFAAMMEAYKYPFYLIHFHPSKALFEWYAELHISHSEEALLISNHLIYFFIHQARMNGNKFPSKSEEKAALIYNYRPTYTGDIVSILQTLQAYFFD